VVEGVVFEKMKDYGVREDEGEKMKFLGRMYEERTRTLSSPIVIKGNFVLSKCFLLSQHPSKSNKQCHMCKIMTRQLKSQMRDHF
jgi:hypothetical protein